MAKIKRNEDPDMSDMMDTDNCDILDPHTPTIYLSGVIDKGMAKKFREAVRELEFVRKSDIALIVIDSVGGMILSSFEILNTMKSSKIEFMTYNISHAYSAGAILLSAGSPGKRFMAPLSNAMIHQVSAGSIGHIEEMRTEMKYVERMNQMIIIELAKNCSTTPTKVLEAITATGSTDLHLDPYEAKAFGLVDEVAYVSLVQAKAYQLEVITEEEPEPVKPKRVRKKPTGKKPAGKTPTPKKTTRKK